MENELLPLAILIALQLIMGLLTTAIIGKFTGSDWLLSSRGKEVDYRATLADRLERARNNGFEAIILFAPIVVILVMTSASNSSTVAAAWVYVIARTVYWAAYAADMVPWRTIIFFVGWMALVWMVFVAISALM